MLKTPKLLNHTKSDDISIPNRLFLPRDRFRESPRKVWAEIVVASCHRILVTELSLSELYVFYWSLES